jgi:hypothetical protein
MIGTGVLGWAVGAAWAGAVDDPSLACGTMGRLAEAPLLRRISPDARPLPGVRVGKDLRDAFGVPNVRTSANFAIWYGDAGGVTVAEVDRLLAAFELAWTVQIGDLGHPPPLSTDAYHFNVYIGDTGNNAPSGYGAGGYYYVDPEGYPMVVIANGSLGDPDFADHAAHHEFYHAIQGSLDRYDYDFDGPSAWYWEATAEWAAIETDAANPTNGPFVFSYLLLPQLSLNAFDYPDTGALEEYYQYGAFLFPHDLTQQLGPALIRDSWLDTGRERDPLEVLRGLVQDEGEDLDQLWLDHLAHNAAYDYDAGPLYRSITQAYAPYYPSAEELLDVVSGDGGAGSASGPDAPRRYGGATILLEAPRRGTLEVRIAGGADGSDGSPAQFGARLARVSGDGVTYLEVPFDGAEGSLDVPGVGPDEAVFLTVGAWTPGWIPASDEKFPFDWSLEVIEDTSSTSTNDTGGGGGGDDDDDDGGGSGDPDPEVERPEPGCGCASGGGVAGGWLLVGAVLAARTRRERR